AVLALVKRTRVRSLFLPPTALNLLRAAEAWAEVDAAALGVFRVHTAGEPLSPEAYAWAKRTFGDVYELYGLTEMGCVIGNCPLFPVRPGSMGKPYPGHDVALLDDRGDPLPETSTETGEI